MSGKWIDYEKGTQPAFHLASEKLAGGDPSMDHSARLFRTICIALAAYLGAGFAALGHPATPFRYDFGPETERFPVTRDPDRNDNTFANYPITGSARGGGIVSLADSAMSQEINAHLDAIPGAPFGYDFPVDYPLGQLSLRPISEPVVPEPSTILGGLAAAGLMVAFLMRRWRQRGSSVPGT
jgi:hypothetical protein